MFGYGIIPHPFRSVLCCSPPPASGLSEKYSNNVDTTLASGLEARSYQPGLNSYKESATLVSLKRRDDSEGSDPSPPPATTPNETDSDPFTNSVTNTINLASTIGKVIDSDYVFFTEGEKVRQKIDGDTGEMVAKYLRRDVYVTSVLNRWVDKSIVKGDGTVTYNFQKVDTLFEDFFYDNMEFIRKLRLQLEKFEAGEALKKPLADIVEFANDFILKQSALSHKIIKGLDAASSEQ
ncbi:hypothetical protein BASA50_010411 [Batrachochytrium salamandrivorans]|uniref:Uncharacterized protein n=1 Tax=Batrachochytrium salamandrivorans TaxID=1357716 RepID=A0ABQ8EYK1_9FUNG|nr:hypothetical protein BASA50_010411 [Batrachochytrium salamandrivorans]